MARKLFLFPTAIFAAVGARVAELLLLLVLINKLPSKVAALNLIP